LDFDPTSFVASATGGSVDITDGQLNYTVMSAGLASIKLFEGGDYTLAGIGTPATHVSAGAIIRATVTQVNGVNVAPIPLLTSNASVGFALPPQQVVQPWSLGTVLNVASQITGLLGPNAKATKVEVAINNTLLAFSEQGTIGFIAKKEFFVDHTVVPEPTTAGLLGLALCGLGIAGARKHL
jgi:hypothetical protein